MRSLVSGIVLLNLPMILTTIGVIPWGITYIGYVVFFMVILPLFLFIEALFRERNSLKRSRSNTESPAEPERSVHEGSDFRLLVFPTDRVGSNARMPGVLSLAHGQKEDRHGNASLHGR